MFRLIIATWLSVWVDGIDSLVVAAFVRTEASIQGVQESVTESQALGIDVVWVIDLVKFDFLGIDNWIGKLKIKGAFSAAFPSC